MNGHRLTIWRSQDRRPSSRAAVLQLTGRTVVPSESFIAFELLLKATGLRGGDWREILPLLRKAGPRRIVLTKRSDFGRPQVPNVEWHPPRLVDGVFEFFCNDWRKGTIEKVSIDDEGNVHVMKVGRGRKFALR